MKKRYIALVLILILLAGYATFRAADRLIHAAEPALHPGDVK